MSRQGSNLNSPESKSGVLPITPQDIKKPGWRAGRARYKVQDLSGNRQPAHESGLLLLLLESQEFHNTGKDNTKRAISAYIRTKTKK